MGMKYQKGTVYVTGKRIKMWYGQYLVYRKDQDGKEIRKQRNVRICPKANTPKWKAEQMLQEIISKETKGVGSTPTLPPDDSVTFRWFVEQRYIPMRQGSWSPAYKKTNTYQLLIGQLQGLADVPAFQSQLFSRRPAFENRSCPGVHCPCHICIQRLHVHVSGSGNARVTTGKPRPTPLGSCVSIGKTTAEFALLLSRRRRRYAESFARGAQPTNPK